MTFIAAVQIPSPICLASTSQAPCSCPWRSLQLPSSTLARFPSDLVSTLWFEARCLRHLREYHGSITAAALFPPSTWRCWSDQHWRIWVTGVWSSIPSTVFVHEFSCFWPSRSLDMHCCQFAGRHWSAWNSKALVTSIFLCVRAFGIRGRSFCSWCCNFGFG